MSPRTRVLFSDPDIEAYAVRVAARAEDALDVLAELFGAVPELTTIRLDSGTDLYNAIAPPLPRPHVVMPALFPALPQVDPGSQDPLYALLLHELTHVAQLAYLERPPGVAHLPRLGLVGETVAPLPPGWLLEGLAVWVAGTHAPGGQVVDTRSRGILHALALEGEWPSLEEVSLLSHMTWPAGEARYLLGGAFVDYLVDEFGWEAILASLREANAGWYPLPFETAWQRSTGAELEEAWRAWSALVEEEAASASAGAAGASIRQLTEGGSASEVLSPDPAGRRLAWRPAGGGLLLSELSTGPDGRKRLTSTRRLLPPSRSPVSLDWLDDHRLLYSRLLPGTARYFGVFEFDLSTGVERRLGRVTRARFVRADPAGCVVYVRDVVSEGSTLMRLCSGEAPRTLYRAPPGSHLVGIDVSESGRIAVAVWRAGRVVLALLEDHVLRSLGTGSAGVSAPGPAFSGSAVASAAGPANSGSVDPPHAWPDDALQVVIGDSSVALDPAWDGDDTLLFRSDRGGVFDLYRVRLPDRTVERLTAVIGGAYTPTPLGDEVLFARIGGEGVDLAVAPGVATPLAVGGGDETAALPDTTAKATGGVLPPAGFTVRPYTPWRSLAPFGWIPQVELVDLRPLSLAASATLLGQDRSGDHGYAVTAGYRPHLGGPLAGGWLSARYDYRATDAFDLFQRPPPWGFGVRAGVWPHRPHLGQLEEMATGITVEFRVRRRLSDLLAVARAQAGALHLPSVAGLQPDARLDLILSGRYSDLWGYDAYGPRSSAHLLWSAGPAGGAGAAWLEASQVWRPSPELPLTTSVVLRAGYRPPPPAPLDTGPLVGFATFGARKSLPVGWRYADGLVALERLTAEARIHGGFDGGFSVAGDVSLWADTMVRYGAPVSLGGSVGYAGGWWYRLGSRVPL